MTTVARPIHALLRFIDASPTPFHAVENIAARLRTAGYVTVHEGDAWQHAPGKYYFTRNASSLVAVHLARPPAEHGYRLVGAHTDSPCLKVKPRAIAVNHGYAKLALEVYGGALLNPWFDRGLGLAGRVTGLEQSGKLISALLNIARPIAFIPSLAIHLDRDVNERRCINRQTDLPAVLCRVGGGAGGGAGAATLDFDQFLITSLKTQHPDLDIDKILAFELSLYDCQAAEVVGLENEFIAAARLDNLASCYAGMEALLAAKTDANLVLALNDHEEVGSASHSGAEGPFLQSTLRRCCPDHAAYARAISRSMLVSADNAHGVHPNFPQHHEPAHQPLLNAGPVIKINSNQRYATDSETAALFRHACERRGLPVQCIVARTDKSCGSTIGPITAAKLGVRTVDIGVPQLGMHSIRELAGVADQATLIAALQAFYEIEDWPF